MAKRKERKGQTTIYKTLHRITLTILLNIWTVRTSHTHTHTKVTRALMS